MCGYQGVRKVSFSENFAYVINESSLRKYSDRLLFTLFRVNIPKGIEYIQVLLLSLPEFIIIYLSFPQILSSVMVPGVLTNL